jgi:hypothetical protein
MAKTTAAKKTAATQAPGADAGDITKSAAPVGEAEAIAGTAPIATGEAAVEGAPPASTAPITEAAPATTGKQLDAEPGTGGVGAEAVAGTVPIATVEPAAEGALPASTDPVTEAAPATTGEQLDAEPGTGGTATADPDSEIPGIESVRISGWVIECKRRDRGLWRAGRFWPPEPTAVLADDLTDDQLQALLAEPLLSVVGVE